MRLSEHEGWDKAFPWELLELHLPTPPPTPRPAVHETLGWFPERGGEWQSQEVIEWTKLIFPRRPGKIKAESPDSTPSYSAQLTLQLLLFESQRHISNIRFLQDLSGHFYRWHWLKELDQLVDEVHSV